MIFLFYSIKTVTLSNYFTKKGSKQKKNIKVKFEKDTFSILTSLVFRWVSFSHSSKVHKCMLNSSLSKNQTVGTFVDTAHNTKLKRGSLSRLRGASPRSFKFMPDENHQTRRTFSWMIFQQGNFGSIKFIYHPTRSRALRLK